MTVLEVIGAFTLFFIIVAVAGFTFFGWKFTVDVQKDEGKKQQMQRVHCAAVGKTYLLSNESPFGNAVIARIMDIRNGYVQYRFVMGDGRLTTFASSMKAGDFLAIYKEVPTL